MFPITDNEITITFRKLWEKDCSFAIFEQYLHNENLVHSMEFSEWCFL